MVNPRLTEVYRKIHDNIETISRVMYVVLIRVSLPGAFVPFIFLSFATYLTSDLKEDAFRLPFPML